ncbi:MAG: hypothetical protein ACD_76C00039G0007 [uncultured bacterium]|nr:MAG: hypothetical protein ACD_76C00039G0007 [uncultured bacterium]HBD05777.1 hypothetical protein [Candidatus Uhrbacteria bacterium]
MIESRHSVKLLFTAVAIVAALALLLAAYFWIIGTLTIGNPRQTRAFPWEYALIRVRNESSIGTSALSVLPSGVYTIVSVGVRNIDSRAHTLQPGIFFIIDEFKNEYVPVCRKEIGSCAEFIEPFTLNELEAGEETIGYFVFDLPDDNRSYFLKIIKEQFSASSVLIEL